jgi:hypothetical protein
MDSNIGWRQEKSMTHALISRAGESNFQAFLRCSPLSFLTISALVLPWQDHAIVRFLLRDQAAASVAAHTRRLTGEL